MRLVELARRQVEGVRLVELQHLAVGQATSKAQGPHQLAEVRLFAE